MSLLPLVEGLTVRCCKAISQLLSLPVPPSHSHWSVGSLPQPTVERTLQLRYCIHGPTSTAPVIYLRSPPTLEVMAEAILEAISAATEAALVDSSEGTGRGEHSMEEGGRSESIDETPPAATASTVPACGVGKPFLAEEGWSSGAGLSSGSTRSIDSLDDSLLTGWHAMMQRSHTVREPHLSLSDRQLTQRAETPASEADRSFPSTSELLQSLSAQVEAHFAAAAEQQVLPSQGVLAPPDSLHPAFASRSADGTPRPLELETLSELELEQRLARVMSEQLVDTSSAAGGAGGGGPGGNGTGGDGAGDGADGNGAGGRHWHPGTVAAAPPHSTGGDTEVRIRCVLRLSRMAKK